MILALALGTLVGEFFDFDGKMEHLGIWLKAKADKRGDSQFVQGFVTASLVVCVGAMAIVGSIQDGLAGDATTLYTKAVIDGIVVMVLASVYGKGAVSYTHLDVYKRQPPAYVKQAADYVQGNLKICTVIGFPNGYNTMAAKIFETKDAVENGASEIDMVINIGWVKDRKWKELAEEIAGVKAACLGRPLKVIIETCLLSDMEKIKLCQVVAKAEAAYLKTSTGFSTGGATREDVALLRENLPESVKVKASGGIRTLEDLSLIPI